MKKSDKKITIKDIAQRSGVSIGTVDRVIHNRGEVSSKTMKKVLRVTKVLNFQPDILASALASKKKVRLATLMPAVDNDSSFWKAPNLGIEKALKEIEHYGVTHSKYLFSISDRNSFIAEAEKVLSDNPDGLLIAPSLQNEALELAKICNAKKIPFVFFNSNISNQNQVCYVGQDSKQSGIVGAKLMDYGLSKGSEILVVSIFRFLKNNNHILNRKQGFLQYFESNKASRFKITSIEINSLDAGDIYKALRNIFNIHPKIKGIFVTNSRVFHVARFIEASNLRGINLIGYDLTDENIPYLEKGVINFLIDQKPVEQSYRAIIALFNKVVLKKNVPEEILLPIDIVIKENLKYYE
ncbi:MAG: LacI family DNA-binding transcriptional regulator [Bacteroidales bacterium]|nr:MAG: LacI family DNA-binding transcriptional regulator [Bacteroidales bacterium]